MDSSKSRLPMMVKKTTTILRPKIASDRPMPLHSSTAPNGRPVVANAKTMFLNSWPVLTQNFESVCNILNNGNHGRPMKRHASPEFRGTKSSVTMSNAGNIKRPKLRRSRSVSDMATVKPISRSALTQAHALKRAAGITLAASSQVPPSKISKPNATAVKAPVIAPTKKPMTSTTALDSKNKTAVKTAGKKIPAYDYKARFQDLNERHKVLKEKHDQLRDKLNEYESLPELYEECQNNLHKLENEMKNVKIQMECMERQANADKVKIESLDNQLQIKTEECRNVTDERNILQQQSVELTTEVTELRDCKVTLTKSVEELTEEIFEIREMLFKASVERKELHNTVMDLRGNIRVFCRVRPPLDKETNRQLCTWNYPDQTMLEISNDENPRKTIKHEFTFDQVFPPFSQQSDVFELVSPLIQSALDGYNVCIFAYGQTGSGKTHTMDGLSTESGAGIIPRTINLVFECFEQYRKLNWDFKLNASFLEIYNETFFDLLSNETKDMEIRMVSAKTPNEIFVSNLTDVDVANKDQLHQLMQLAKSNRATASTVGNERSSRSHAVTQLRLIGHHAEKNEVSVGTINLIDLAGSESPKTSIRMDETKKINKSLSELTNVIMALLQKQDHIPYRNSKLTHLLMPSLGGNSKTLMFVNVAPFQDCFVETVKSLRFAASVNNCKMNKAKKNKFYTQQPHQTQGASTSNSSPPSI